MDDKKLSMAVLAFDRKGTLDPWKTILVHDESVEFIADTAYRLFRRKNKPAARKLSRLEGYTKIEDLFVWMIESRSNKYVLYVKEGKLEPAEDISLITKETSE